MNWDATQDSHIEAVDSVTVRGYRFSDGWARGQKIYFCTRFSRPFTRMTIDSTAIERMESVSEQGSSHVSIMPQRRMNRLHWQLPFRG